MVIVAMVAMIGGMPPLATKSPLIEPKIKPISVPTTKHSQGSIMMPSLTINATAIPENARVDVTDKSMPAVSMTIIWAMATTISMDASNKMILKLLRFRK
jgi:hypothetical protein